MIQFLFSLAALPSDRNPEQAHETQLRKPPARTVVSLRFPVFFACDPISLLTGHRNVIKVRFLGIFACQRNSFHMGHGESNFLRFPGKFACFYPIFHQYSPFIPFITGLDLYRTNEISIQH